ncbi:MAG: hypothetical protein IJV08_03355 [Bacteroidaceae bacterium]|nr:hypothetical protein [Bacteroidaceae bacterium]
MNYSHPQIRRIARRIPVLCALYFILFAFCYLRFVQSELMAQTQFLLSGGTTVYHPLFSALLCTFLLTLLGLFLGSLLRWLPLRMKASVWWPSFLLLGLLTHWRFPQFGDQGSALRGWTVALLVLLGLLWFFVARLFTDSSKERETFSTYAWPNALQLVLFTCACLSLGNTDVVLHRTLRSARLLHDGDCPCALDNARWERHPSRQLSALTALALSRTGQLGEQLFAYAQPHGSDGLLPALSDTLLFYNLPRAVGEHLGYKKGDKTRATRFLEVISAMPETHPEARDYQLCAYLLDRRLDDFAALLLASDTLSPTLPRHYREAMLLYRHFYPSVADAPDAPSPSLGHPLGDELTTQFEQFLAVLGGRGTHDEREFRCRKQFPATYWTYYFFGS